uniref:Uncharacterized protein n=1 Tax=Plectus sambesii TaxID=2011161 RepID=A0A914W6H0_9BILA
MDRNFADDIVGFESGDLSEQTNYHAQPLQALLGRAPLVSSLGPNADFIQIGAMPSNAMSAAQSSGRMEESGRTSVIQLQNRETSNDFADSVSCGLCAICGDRATGNHYGVISCNGCKGFFRRTCWKNQRYVCRFSDNCLVDKDHRNACRFCRFQKCLMVGMKREAIQNERDSIGCSSSTKRLVKDSSRKRSQPAPDETDDDDSDVGNADAVESPSSASDSRRKKSKNDLLDDLLAMEARCNLHSVVMLSKTNQQNVQSISAAVDAPSDLARPAEKFYRGLRKATIADLQDSWRTALLLMVEWAKGVKPFPDLPTDDKLSLLRNYAAQHLLLLPAYKTPDDNMICLINDCYVPRDTDLPDINNVVNRCLDELVAPMRRLGMTEAEFVLMKTLAFMNPETKGLLAETRPLIRQTREQAIQALYDYEHKHFAPSAAKRFGTLLLLAPQLKEIAQLLVENIQLAKLFGLATVDQLLEELILVETDGSGRRTIEGGNG